MEALVAVGLASNILQFVDFAKSVVSDAQKFHEATSGAQDEYQEAEDYARRLQRLVAQIAMPHVAHGSRISGEEKELKKLCEQCSQIANELLVATKDITATSHNDCVKSAKKAVKARLSSSQIKSLQTRLDRISQQLTGTLLQTQLKRTDKTLSSMADENRRLSSRRDADISHLQQQLQYVVTLLESSEDQQNAGISLSDISETGAQFSAEQLILGRLFFHGMNERHTNVHVEHEETLSWIFQEDSPVRFTEYLENESNLYWVSGKPGSGKSTAMKYICQHPTTKRRLEQWANEDRLITAKFFFWNPARSSLLKSQEGLLRSILYQILHAAPSLIPHAFPEDWIAYLSGGLANSSSKTGAFSISQLLAAIKLLCNRLSALEIKVCIFVDGLDEYDGRPDDMIKLIEALKTSANLKACISSRPWNEFERAFGRDQRNKLYMQDLTKSDIRKYVRDTLENDETFRELVVSEGEESSMSLVHDIVNAAQGVFLWVILVVRSLLEGLTNADTFNNLQRRLRSLPTDLDEYFERLLFSVDDFYSSQAAAMCLATLTAATPLPLMSYWFMDQKGDRYALDLPIQPMEQQLIESRLTTMKRRLNACSKGLLETTQIGRECPKHLPRALHDYFFQEVDFLHRTVRDFLSIPQTQNRLLDRVPESFNPGIIICRAFLAQIKSVPHHKELFPKNLKHLPEGFLMHAVALEDERVAVETEVELMDELCSALRAQEKPIGEDTLELFTFRYSTNLLTWCLESNLLRYIFVVLEKERKPSRDELSRLLAKTNSGVGDTRWSESQLQLIRHLLRVGADPYFHLDSSRETPWTRLLDIIGERRIRSKEKEAIMFSIIEEYAKHGATLQSIDHGGPSDYKRKLKERMTKEQFNTLLRLADRKRTKAILVRGMRRIPGLRRFLRKSGRHG